MRTSFDGGLSIAHIIEDVDDDGSARDMMMHCGEFICARPRGRRCTPRDITVTNYNVSYTAPSVSSCSDIIVRLNNNSINYFTVILLLFIVCKIDTIFP